MKRAFLLAFVLTATPLGAQTVDVQRRELLAGGRSADEVKRDALYAALADAVRRVSGVMVQGTELSSRSDSGGHIVDRYVEAVRVDAAGRATAWAVLKEGWRTEKSRALGDQLYYELSLRVTVERESGTRDPGFTVRLSANATHFAVRSEIAAENDEMIARVVVSQDAFITLVSIAGDSVYVLTPNSVVPEVRAGPPLAVELPEPALRRMGLHYRVALPFGVRSRTELLAVVATRRPVALFAPHGEGEARDSGTLTLAEFNRWLVSIPLDQRAVAQLPIEVKRTP